MKELAYSAVSINISYFGTKSALFDICFFYIEIDVLRFIKGKSTNIKMYNASSML
jgi:hypothetical protein